MQYFQSIVKETIVFWIFKNSIAAKDYIEQTIFFDFSNFLNWILIGVIERISCNDSRFFIILVRFLEKLILLSKAESVKIYQLMNQCPVLISLRNQCNFKVYCMQISYTHFFLFLVFTVFYSKKMLILKPYFSVFFRFWWKSLSLLWIQIEKIILLNTIFLRFSLFTLTYFSRMFSYHLKNLVIII